MRASSVVALGLAALLSAPFEVAKSGAAGFGVQVATPDYYFDYYARDYNGGDLITRFVVPAEPRAWISCHRRQETVTVPSQDGATREIRVTRC